jgi:asparagine synthase (glutamine-hydrolysing)
MCGICGAFYYEVSGIPEQIADSIAKLRKRGPDGIGSASGTFGGVSYELGQTRLAICDTRDIEVPYRYPYLGIMLAFNGEVYNHQELREILSDGTPWQTACDSEVVARAWRKWGVSCFERFNGMFAMAIVDERQRLAVLSRDRAGVKPLYLRTVPGALYFASEAKALPGPFVEKRCLEEEIFEFDCRSETPFEGIYSLLPGTFLSVHGDYPGSVNPLGMQKWWSMPKSVDHGMTWEGAVDELLFLVRDAIRIRVPTEVPYAQLLSGGLDSAIIQAVAWTDAKYVVTFPKYPDFDFMNEARRAARNMAVTPVTFDEGQFCQAMPDIVKALDTPAIWTAACQWFLFKRIRKDGHKVALSGEGADELFAGYSRYRPLWWLDRMARDPCLQGYGPTIATVMDGSNPISGLLYRGKRTDAGMFRLAMILREFMAEDQSLADTASRVEFHTTMQVLLRILDRMSMVSGVEARTPFLDHRIVEFAARCPMKFKITENESKAVLREVARRLGVPRQITDEKTKRGFALPWPEWRHVVAQMMGEANSTDGLSRGPWDRGLFVRWQKRLWRQAFGLSEPESSSP